MSSPVSQLAVTEKRCTVTEDERTGWLRRRPVERTTTFLDWTIDGRPLRDHVPCSDGRVGRESLRALVDERAWTATRPQIGARRGAGTARGGESLLGRDDEPVGVLLQPRQNRRRLGSSMPRSSS